MPDKSLTNNEIQELRKRLRARRLFLDLTYQELAEKTGMSKSTLQRYETGGIKNLPYSKIPILSEALGVSPSYFTDLDQDYTSTDTIKDSHSNFSLRSQLIERARKFEVQAITQITPKLIQQGYTVEKQHHGSLGDIVAIRGKEVWHIDFKFTSDLEKHPVGSGRTYQEFLFRLGRLAVYQGQVTKYSILTNLRMIGEQMIQQYNPRHLDIEISVLYLTGDGYEELFFQK
jgi:transcriptional regulator with XRE-family HTH domain